MRQNIQVRKSPAALAADRVFNREYTKKIANLVISAYGGSYQNFDELKHSWRTILPHTPEIADFLILQTKSFIRINGSTNLDFLKELIQLISGYLSHYFNKIPGYGTSGAEYKKLMQILYYDFSYIKNIKLEQQAQNSKPLKLNKPAKFTNGKTTVNALDNFSKAKGMVNTKSRSNKSFIK